MTANAILSVENLIVELVNDGNSERSASTRLLDKVNLAVASGEVLGLIGGSGAGKSTLGRALLGYSRPGSRIAGGRIEFGGEDVLRMSDNALRRLRGGKIAYVAQSPAATFNPSLTLGNQVAENVRIHRQASRTFALQRTVELFARLDLPDPEQFASRYPHQVSGGQLQRAMIAMALAGEPSVIVFDEPTTALDAQTRGSVVELISGTIRERGVSAIYISHDLDVVGRIADRIVEMRAGRIESEHISQQGRFADLRRSFKELARSVDSSPAGLRNAVLNVERVSARFTEEREVVKDVSLMLSSGSILGIVGESGSGKSTLGRVICGLHGDYRGDVSLCGKVLAKSYRSRTMEQLKQVQMVYQSAETALNPEHRVQRILGRTVRRLHGHSRIETKRIVVELLSMVGLDSTFLRRKIGEMSGGQIQRVGIARALAARPDVIVLDEVTSALDGDTAQGILNLLRKLRDETGAAYLFISHDLSSVAKLCDNVGVMCDGELVEFGETDVVFEYPQHRYTRALIYARATGMQAVAAA
ncbi:ABC transporter ATP-binding protein [Burkholderia cepacia]|uniref:ABC transporter ATP-binding protein n=1 Tax=Burkholderia cepacia TaxID=292 RepID=UPI001F28235F|nr:ABC transporter ATP-binding protein [Burkholderia cepacia]MCE4124384.1 ABC transporter ATP-binding protein [Burkholderia cepacia]